jgi:hypothetical protein
MGYYQAGDYYRGDGNYAAGGLFGFLGKVAKGIVKASPIGSVATALAPTLFDGAPKITNLVPALKPKPGIKGTLERLVPGGESGYMVGGRRRINVANVKALRRAGRRVRGFLKLASRMGALPVNRGKGKLFKKKRR